MRIGGGIVKPYNNPEEWLVQVKDLNYSTVLSPVAYDTPQDVKNDYLKCIKDNDLTIGEVGIWRSPISADDKVRNEAMEYCKNQLALADEIGANCCVNVAGAQGEVWDGFYKENYHDDTYDLIVDTVREIIDSVKPKNTFYTLEPMPWMVPDSPDSYLKLIKDIDRPAFAVHMDYTNMINNPKRYVYRDEFIKECFDKLGPYIKSVHIKDCYMKHAYSCVIEETMPGKGTIDFVNVLRLCENLGRDMTVFVEHLTRHEEYKEAVTYVRNLAEENNIEII